MEKCCICEKRFEVKDASSVLGRRGVEKIKPMESSINAQVGDRVHIDCCRNLARPCYTAKCNNFWHKMSMAESLVTSNGNFANFFPHCDFDLSRKGGFKVYLFPRCRHWPRSIQLFRKKQRTIAKEEENEQLSFLCSHVQQWQTLRWLIVISPVRCKQAAKGKVVA